jgi:hypothetical protein
MDSQIFDRTTIKIIVLSVIVFIGSLIFRQLLLESTSIIKLHSGSYLSGAISQSLASSTANSSKEGVNYSIVTQKFFDNNLYAVIILKPLNNSSLAGLIVFKNLSGLYMPVLGPGTEINVNYLFSFPKDLTQYLISTGYTYEPTY